ncbi:MmcQ/YjbR family DNA-binding protein [Pseudarthrobacter sp. J64]|uniref:MmcQ/YjbR family DNA-binding protein n=1 Tax=Pseudarthrobacter sp. J64 TaxID=3116485 RepID=UPI002E82330D|nr:MmcQ/YjbR family DNA-binding protein [Pseudarthrobacter sp. J64]MEE2569879.1 MmcQ/YjbR family DNA-binding protein [Pseudarthrobacter sp. J64]
MSEFACRQVWLTALDRAIMEHMATEEDVRRICLALPGVVERPSWNMPAWFARTLMARMWEDGVLTVKSTEREALAGTDPDTYFWTPHHNRSPGLVLVRLTNVDREELDELLQESYRIAGGPKR